MSACCINEISKELDHDLKSLFSEATPSNKLERRRKIEDLAEKKRLREELAEFA